MKQLCIELLTLHSTKKPRNFHVAKNVQNIFVLHSFKVRTLHFILYLVCNSYWVCKIPTS